MAFTAHLFTPEDPVFGPPKVQSWIIRPLDRELQVGRGPFWILGPSQRKCQEPSLDE